MLFEYSYSRSTSIAHRANDTVMSFSPDMKRDPTFFRGDLRHHVAFREAISALHDVVISDLRFSPKDGSAYKDWVQGQENVALEIMATQRDANGKRIQELSAELKELRRNGDLRRKPLHDARRRYFTYLYEKERDVWFALDPVITVHPDQVFFECFSQDESSYGRLSVGYDVFKNIDEISYGTTNIDYSSGLYGEFQKIRSYKTTRFEIDPSGFNVRTASEDAFKEVKIDLPESWVRGFLQVSSAMSLPTTRVALHPMDVHNVCLALRRRRETHGPRGLRYHLTPDAPVKIVLEPWETVIDCPRSIFTGDRADVIRVWGRRRLHILERLIPIAKQFTVYLLGSGMPSFYVADLNEMQFTLGLSGWTANDWAQAGNFDLMAPRADADDYTKQLVFHALKRFWFRDPNLIAEQFNLDRSVTLGALAACAQAGRAIFDLSSGVYRARELSREPLPMDALRFANPREESATRFLAQRAVALSVIGNDIEGVRSLEGVVKDGNKAYTPSVTIDRDERIVQAKCTCSWHVRNKLFKGPCEHILALRMFHARQRFAL
jgi:hypothetical protein